MFTVAVTVCLCWCLQNNAVGAELTPPRNVHMVTMNTNYTVVWDRPQSPAVAFATEYIAEFKLRNTKKKPKWSAACENSTRRSCDLTGSNLLYRGSYVIRVRADLDGRQSDWVRTVFCPDEHADVGPPSKVDLSLAGSVLDVVIADPLTSGNASMKEVLSGLYYRVIYWEGPADAPTSGVRTLNSSANLVTLPGLKGWTWYCVRVQSRADFYGKISSFSPPQCLRTEGATPWWQMFLHFLGLLTACVTIVILVLFVCYPTYKTVKATIFPISQLPPHFKKYFCDSPDSDVPRLLHLDPESELLYDQVIINPEAGLEIHPPLLEVLPVLPSGLAPDSSGRHSRQDSSSSRDSGVYSAGGVCGLRQSSIHSSEEAETSWQSTFDPEQVTMQDMVPGPKAPPAITDEGIEDVSF
ncbi:interleukin-10 receptor subunit beta [Brachionichthys hirsutus]|uniref:interleukin-10 receptor subunit beta n=1 Tax=Brachionichthys hirsutus TaxID=412623 RepID=UPI003605000C